MVLLCYEVDPPATNMKDLKWDEGLANLSQAWSDLCDIEHGNVPELKDVNRPDGKKYGPLKGTGTGQNLAQGRPTMSMKTAIDKFDDEKKDYDYCSNSANPPTAMVGHYTQVLTGNQY